MIARGRPFDRFVYLASGPSYPIALEASLRVQEMSIADSEAYHSLDDRHRPKATADRNALLPLFSLPDDALGLSLARDVKALGVTLMVVVAGADRYGGIADLAISSAARLDEGVAGALSLVQRQTFAYETAMRRGGNPDAPQDPSEVVILEPLDG